MTERNFEGVLGAPFILIIMNNHCYVLIMDVKYLSMFYNDIKNPIVHSNLCLNTGDENLVFELRICTKSIEVNRYIDLGFFLFLLLFHY